MKHAAATTAAHAPGKSAQQQQNADHSVSTAPDSEAAAQPAHSSPQAEQASTSSAAGQSTGSPASSTAGNSSAPADTGGGGKRHLVHALAPAVVLATCAATSLWLALRLMHSRQRHGEHSASSRRSSNARNHQQHSRTQRQHAAAEPPEPASTLAVFASDFQLHTQDVALPARPAALEGLSCVVSEHIPIQGATIGCGVPALWSQQPTAQAHASLTQKLVNKGFSIVGQGSTQPFNYPTVGSNLRNPAARFRVCGGGASGAVCAVAQQQAHLALGSDFLGSVRLPAACQGVFALVCTPGVYQPNSHVAPAPGGAAGDNSSTLTAAARGSDGGSSGRSSSSRRVSSGGLESAGLVAGDVSVLRRVAEHLALPGVSDLRGELTQVVVAEDLFALCEQDMEQGLLCMKRAVLQWAGQEQAGSVQLLPFLENNCRSWSNLAAAADASPLSSVTTGSGAPLPPVLRAITYAAQLLYTHELAQRYGNTAAAAAAAGGLAGRGAVAAGASDDQQQQPGQQQPGQQQPGQDVLDPAVAAAIAAGLEADPQQLEYAWQLLQEVQDTLNTAVRHDVVVVVPSTPAPPPRLDAPAPLLHSWLGRCHAFAALTAYGGVPCVVVPVGQLDSSQGGGAPLSVCLFGHSRSDQRLLTVAERLAMHAQAEFRKIEDKRAADAAAATAAQQAAPGESDRRQQAQQQQQGNSRRKQPRVAQQQQPQPEQVDVRRLAKADKAKARGNEAFKQGKYREAIKAYSEAAKLDPTNPVYLSNRALCYLRLFSFEAAEADCNAVLSSFPSLCAPDQVKALLRRGTARIHKNELEGAAADFRQVLLLEPNNRQAREELKAMQQQQREMQEEQRRALAGRMHANPVAAAAAGGGGGSAAAVGATSGAGGLPLSLYPPGGGVEGGSGVGAEGGLFGRSNPAVSAAAAAAAAAGELSAEEFEAMRAMLQSGSLPVLLGDEGVPVVGPRGEPVIVGPGGQRMTVGPSGGMQPYHNDNGQQRRGRRSTSSSQ